MIAFLTENGIDPVTFFTVVILTVIMVAGYSFFEGKPNEKEQK
jgi:predicted negative regulator of RcsB-dependent stress response